jgi:signal transduction histidine kinase
MFIRYPVFDLSYNAFFLLNIWSDPYATFGCILLLLSFAREQNFKVKQQKLFVFITVTPTIVFLMFTTYICPLFSLRDIYRFNLIIVITTVMLFIFAFKYGFLGFKLSFQKSDIDAIRAISSVTSLINHAVKNETVKISICAENLKKFINANNANQEAIEDINIINYSADHILNMMERIQEKTKEIFIDEQTTNLSEVIENAIFTSKPLIEGKNIIFKKGFLIDVFIKIDKVHIRDVLSNIIQNAVESMNQNGEIKICLLKTKNEVLLSLQDNGIGIPQENIAHVLEPFFSTKNRQLNYGLGLSYCYNVMQKHGGTIEILSEENKGTQVILKFPLKRVAKLIQPEVLNG